MGITINLFDSIFTLFTIQVRSVLQRILLEGLIIIGDVWNSSIEMKRSNDKNDISHNNYDTTSTYVLWFNTYLYQKNS